MQRSEWSQVLGALGLLTQLGFTVVVCTLVGGLAGGGLDRLLGLGAPALVGGILVGVAAGAVSAYRLVMSQVERRPPPQSGRKEPGPGSGRED